jgi:nicotinamide-nucleotide amidase
VSAVDVVKRLRDAGLMLTTAESCTGGLVAAAVTDVEGASAVLDRGFVTYSNAAKTEMLGVPVELLDLHGAVSMEVAYAMAEGALAHSKAQIAIAITGIAGPTGGSLAKPVGLVHFACATQTQTVHLEKRFGDKNRRDIRESAVATALQLILNCV